MNYIKNVIKHVTLPGAMFIGLVAVVLSILFVFTNNQLIQAFGGTSILIMIGVALDTMSKVESQLKMYNYDGFFRQASSRPAPVGAGPFRLGDEVLRKGRGGLCRLAYWAESSPCAPAPCCSLYREDRAPRAASGAPS